MGDGDICAKEGIHLPALSSHTVENLSLFISMINQGLANPMDVPIIYHDKAILTRTIELLDADPEIDMIILRVNADYLVGFFGGPGQVSPLEHWLKSRKADNSNGKPIVVAFLDEGYPYNAEKKLHKLRQLGITVFPSLPRACRALKRFADYHRFLGNTEKYRT